MPKKTFFNLPSEKKEKIIEAVYDLFIENSEISLDELKKQTINKIKKFLKI